MLNKTKFINFDRPKIFPLKKDQARNWRGHDDTLWISNDITQVLKTG